MGRDWLDGGSSVVENEAGEHCQIVSEERSRVYGDAAVLQILYESIKRLECPVQIEKLSNELLDSCDQFRETMGEVTDNISLAVALETLWGERIENSSSGEACPAYVTLACPGQGGLNRRPSLSSPTLQNMYAKHCKACLGIFDGLPFSLQLISMHLLQRLHVPKRTLGP